MTPGELTTRVTVECAVGVAALAAVSAWLGGSAGALGAAAGGAIAVVNFRWLARAGALAGTAGRASLGAAGVLAGLRYLATFGALGAALASGWVHPLALMAGLAVLPLSVIASGLAAARQAEPR